MKLIREEDGIMVVRFPSDEEKMLQQKEKFASFRKQHDRKRTIIDKISDEITEFSGSFAFLVFNIIFFGLWIAMNVGLFPHLVPFDPYPFGMLTMIVSLEAIFLSIFVLLSQSRQAKIGELREETHLHIDTVAEKEITKLIQMQVIIMKKLGIRIKGDEELEKMMQDLNTKHIQKQLEKDVIEASMTDGLVSAPQRSVNKVLKKISKLFNSD